MTRHKRITVQRTVLLRRLDEYARPFKLEIIKPEADILISWFFSFLHNFILKMDILIEY